MNDVPRGLRPDVRNYRTIPALRDYIDRIGAEQTNFRKFVVRRRAEDGGYFTDIAAVRLIGRDGTIKVVHGEEEEVAPTEQELTDIKAAFAATDLFFPKSIPAPMAQVKLLRLKLGVADADLFVMFNDVRTGVLMAQQRVQNKDGTKGYHPWTYFDDGEWYRMEPDGLLPLWKPAHQRHLAIMLHEGAKAASFCDWLCHWDDPEARTARAEHPWAADLCGFDHWGWIGGAPNPHRTDWAELVRANPSKLIMVCDNDQGGEDAARPISQRLMRPMQVIRFGKDFPAKFDLADEFPRTLWKEKRGRVVYAGPTFGECLHPATWATKKIGHDGAGRPAFALRDEFAREWAFSIVPDAFVYLPRLGRRYSAAEFNADVATFSDVDNVAKLRRKKLWGKAATIVYDPSKASGLIASGSGHVINLYYPSAIKPRRGNLVPFYRFLINLIPAKGDRREVMRYIATLRARPDIKMIYNLLLISETQGVGKSTLAEKILAPVIGQHNVSFPSAFEVTDSGFNEWRAFKRLAVIEELYDNQTSRAYNRLKNTTAENIKINEKYEMKNWIHIVASSNSFRALKMAGTDRRWLIPGITEKKQDVDYWKKFNAWLADGGLEAIAWWAAEYVKDPKHVVQAGEHAPDSEAKNLSVFASMSDGERLIYALGEDLAEPRSPPRQIVVRLDKIRDWLALRKATIDHHKYGDDGRKFLEGHDTIAMVLKKIKGLYLSQKRFKTAGERFFVVANFKVEGARWLDLANLCLTPDDVESL